MEWDLLQSEDEQDFRIFRLRKDLYRRGSEEISHPFIVLDAPDWANVVAFTADGDLVLVRQFRFGIAADIVEIPGGMIDAGEEPLAAARRELLEETGFASDDWVELGWVYPNPAFMSNRCHSFLARNCVRVAAQSLDETEAISVELWSPERYKAAFRAGEFRSSLVFAALSLYLISPLRD